MAVVFLQRVADVVFVVGRDGQLRMSFAGMGAEVCSDSLRSDLGRR